RSALRTSFFRMPGMAAPAAAFNELRPIAPVEQHIVELSKLLGTQRIDLTTTAKSAYSFLQFTTIFTILVGLITTILVSLSSTDFGKGDSRAAKTLRVLAIVFPAIGTASAAVIAFYGPQAEVSRATHVLASVRQLHDQMALGVWNLKCVK